MLGEDYLHLDLLLHRGRTCWRWNGKKFLLWKNKDEQSILIQQMKETQTHVPTENNIQLHERSVNMPRFQAFVNSILLINPAATVFYWLTQQQKKKNPFKNENQFKNITSLTLRVNTIHIRTCFQKSRFLYSGFCRMIITNLLRKLMFIFC